MSIILVSGAPGTGKSTVACSLAEIFDFTLLTKDTIKESLFDSLGARLGEQMDSPVELSRALSRAAIDLLWSLAPSCPDVILEANFRPKSEGERDLLRSKDGSWKSTATARRRRPRGAFASVPRQSGIIRRTA
jgi:predicted kinase